MQRRHRVEDDLAEVAKVREDPEGPYARDTLLQALASKSSVVVAAAARVIGDNLLRGFEKGMSEAFVRFLVRPERSDPACLAKTAIAKALAEVESPATEVFSVGIRHVQRQIEDTAVELRGYCAFGLVRVRAPNALAQVARLIADPEVMARVHAARALGASGEIGIGPLLRYVIYVGNQDARVVGAALESLIALEREEALDVVREVLYADDEEARTMACLALGESRVSGALPLLIEAFENAVTDDALGPPSVTIAMLRTDPAWEYLLTQIGSGSVGRARHAAKALSVYRSDPSLVERVAKAVEERGDPKFEAMVRDLFRA